MEFAKTLPIQKIDHNCNGMLANKSCCIMYEYTKADVLRYVVHGLILVVSLIWRFDGRFNIGGG